jgi:hypothetical protein
MNYLYYTKMEKHNIFDELMTIVRNTTENHFHSDYYREFGSVLKNHIHLNREATIEEFNDFAKTNTYTIRQWVWFLELMRGVAARDFTDNKDETFTNLYIEVCKFYIRRLEIVKGKIKNDDWSQLSMKYFTLADLFAKKGDFIQRDNYIKGIINKKITRDRKQWLADLYTASFYYLLIFTPKIVYDIFSKELLLQSNNLFVMVTAKLIFAVTTLVIVFRYGSFAPIRFMLWRDDVNLHKQLILERRIDRQLKSAGLRARCGEFDERLAGYKYFDDLFNPIKIIRSYFTSTNN